MSLVHAIYRVRLNYLQTITRGSILFLQFIIFQFTNVESVFAATSSPNTRNIILPEKSHWVQITTDGGFKKRDDSKVFPFDNQIIMSQGYEIDNVNHMDLLRSTSPGKFKIVNAHVPYGAYAPIAVHNGWVYTVDTVLRKTQDFIHYTTVRTFGRSPGLMPTHHLKSLNGKLHLIGANKVWSINPEDTKPTWTSANLPWHARPERIASAVEVFKDRIVIVAGAYKSPNTKKREKGYNYTSLNDVWSSETPEDPNSWIRHTASVPFAPRMWPAIVVHGAWLYISGGYNNILGSPNNFNDTWRTSDLDHWRLVEVSTNYPARHALSLYIQNGQIYLAAGNTNKNSSTQKDVWKLIIK